MVINRNNWPPVIALILFGLFVAITLLSVNVVTGQTPVSIVNNPTFDGMDGWTIWDGNGVTHTLDFDYEGDDGAAKFLTKTAVISQSVNFSETGTYIMRVEVLADDSDCNVKLCFLDGNPLGNCSWGPVNTTDWFLYPHGFYAYDPGYMDITLEWFNGGGVCTSTEIYMDDVTMGYWPPEPTETPTPTPTETPTPTPTETLTSTTVIITLSSGKTFSIVYEWPFGSMAAVAALLLLNTLFAGRWLYDVTYQLWTWR
jgi:hypothetical protein